MTCGLFVSACDLSMNPASEVRSPVLRNERDHRLQVRLEVRPRPELLRGTEASGAQLKAQIPWLRVFVEGVVIVGSILLAFGIEAS